jgi:HSP20 family protein
MNDLTPTRTANSKPAEAELGAMNWLRGELDRMFEEFALPGRSILSYVPRLVSPVPAVELVDDGDSYKLTAELAGLTEKDIKLEVADGVLLLASEKDETSERHENGHIISERRHGSFRRRIPLPSDADADKVEAKFKHGLLTVKIEKAENPRDHVRKIKIGG